jgi:hypothetical protein
LLLWPAQNSQEFPGRDNADSELLGTGKIPDVVCYQIIGIRLNRELENQIVVGIP